MYTFINKSNETYVEVNSKLTPKTSKKPQTNHLQFLEITLCF